MKRCFYILLLAGYLLAGCGTFASAAPNQPPNLPFTLVTAAPNASPTPTPFQPIPLSPTATLLPSPTFDPSTATPTVPLPTETPLPTIDPNILMNTLVAKRYIRRRRSRDDRRQQLCSLTASGRRLIDALIPHVKATQAGVVAGLSQDEALRNAPASAHGMFIVPKIVE